MKCPTCKAKLYEHAGPKAGRGHCDACGICWAPEDLKPAPRAEKVTSGTDD